MSECEILSPAEVEKARRRDELLRMPRRLTAAEWVELTRLSLEETERRFRVLAEEGRPLGRLEQLLRTRAMERALTSAETEELERLWSEQRTDARDALAELAALLDLARTSCDHEKAIPIVGIDGGRSPSTSAHLLVDGAPHITAWCHGCGAVLIRRGEEVEWCVPIGAFLKGIG